MALHALILHGSHKYSEEALACIGSPIHDKFAFYSEADNFLLNYDVEGTCLVSSYSMPQYYHTSCGRGQSSDNYSLIVEKSVN